MLLGQSAGTLAAFLMVFGLSALQPYPHAAATALPEESPNAAVSQFSAVTLTAAITRESGHEPAFILETSTPVLKGSSDPRVAVFNQRAAGIVHGLVADFRSGFNDLVGSDLVARSFFDVTFRQFTSPGDIISIRFSAEGYHAGAAHPYHITRTLNFSLKTGQELDLGMLFRPETDYLEIIADYCTTELSTRDIGFAIGFTGGADPRPENYRSWNLAEDGLLITFDEYQVAPYAAGSQEVLVPFSVLRESLKNEFIRVDRNGLF